MKTNYVMIESTPEQDLQAEMNIIDRQFIDKQISNKKKEIIFLFISWGRLSGPAWLRFLITI